MINMSVTKRRIRMIARVGILTSAINFGYGVPEFKETAATYSSIAHATQDKNRDFIPDLLGQRVRVKGTITYIRSNAPNAFQVYIQDDTGGVMVFCREKPAWVEGDVIEVEGTVDQWKGAEEITKPAIKRLGKSEEIKPKLISVTDLNSEKFFGQLVAITGKIVSSGSNSYQDYFLIDDGQAIATIYIGKDNKQGINISTYKEKSVVRVIGIAYQYAPNEPFNTGYEILPRRPQDLKVIKEPPILDAKQFALVLSIIAILCAAALVWVFTLRKKIKDKSRELESVHQQLIQAERLSSMGQLVSGVAHELNNPLFVISGFAQLLQAEINDQRNLPNIERIIEAAGSASKIVRNLLTFARKQKLEKKHTNINALVKSTIELKAYQLKNGNVEVDLDLDAHESYTEVDPQQIQQVFFNIISNAQDAMGAAKGNGKLTIRTEKIGGQVIISFIDNGPGMSRETLKRIFDPFFTTKEVGKGTGLGLSISYGIIKEHGGQIQVLSEEGHGAMFQVELPAAAAPSLQSEKLTTFPATQVSKSASSAARILVVDDESSVALLLSGALSCKGYQVELCDNANSVLTKIQDGEVYDLMIMDMKMPGMSGQELYRKIWSITPSQAQRIIFITGDMANPETQAFLSVIENKVLEKPVQLSQLWKVIAGALKVA